MNAEEREILDLAAQNLQAAELLTEEGFYSIAVSRGYYAMFYTAEALLLRHGLHFSKHSAVIAAFGKEFSKTGELDPKFHEYLIKAQALRLAGDYDHTESISEESAKQLLIWAGEFLAIAKEFLK